MWWYHLSLISSCCRSSSGGVLAPHTFQHLYGLHSWEDIREIKLRCMLWECQDRYLDFVDDAVIFAEILDILLGALEVLHEKSKPQGLQVSWVKTKIQVFNDILDTAILSVTVCGEDVEVMVRFTYLGSDINISAGCEPEVN